MKKLVYVTLIIFLIIAFSYNTFAFSFVEEGFPKEPDHNLKWIMMDVNGKKYYFETVNEIDLESLDGYMIFDKYKLNNGRSIIIYRFEDGEWKSRSVSYQSIELRTYKILYTNYNIPNEFIMFKPYMRFIENCLNVSDIIAFGITMFAVVISATIITRNGWLL